MTEGIEHEHPDVNGGWLRPAVFGAMDGLVSNFALAMGVAGGATDTDAVVLAGLAGLAAGAFSMAAGEYTSVASQSEAALKEVAVERAEIVRNAPAEEAELAAYFVEKGMDEDVAREAAHDVHRDLDNAVRVHAEVELGVDVDDLPSPTLAAGSSFVSFAVGAVLPIAPFLLGATSVWPAVVVSLLALFLCGAVVTRFTARPWWFGGTRQLVLGGLAAALTYGVGTLVGGTVG